MPLARSPAPRPAPAPAPPAACPALLTSALPAAIFSSSSASRASISRSWLGRGLAGLVLLVARLGQFLAALAQLRQARAPVGQLRLQRQHAFFHLCHAAGLRRRAGALARPARAGPRPPGRRWPRELRSLRPAPPAPPAGARCHLPARPAGARSRAAGPRIVRPAAVSVPSAPPARAVRVSAWRCSRLLARCQSLSRSRSAARSARCDVSPSSRPFSAPVASSVTASASCTRTRAAASSPISCRQL